MSLGIMNQLEMTGALMVGLEQRKEGNSDSGRPWRVDSQDPHGPSAPK